MRGREAVVFRDRVAAAEGRHRGVAHEPERRQGEAAADGEPFGVLLADVVPPSGVEQAHTTELPTALHGKRPRLIYVASSFPYGRNDVFFGPEVRELRRQGVDLLVVPV